MKNLIFVVLTVMTFAAVTGCTHVGKGKNPVVVTNG